MVNFGPTSIARLKTSLKAESAMMDLTDAASPNETDQIQRGDRLTLLCPLKKQTEGEERGKEKRLSRLL